MAKDNGRKVRAGVAVMLFKENRVLIGKRTGSHGSGVWAFPGGKFDEPDNSFKDCGEREVWEETGIICNVFSPDRIRDDVFTTFDILSEDGSERWVTSYLFAEYLSGGNKMGEDKIQPLEPTKCEEWRWVTLDELVFLCTSEGQRQWIPINQVIYFFKQLWNLK